MNKERTILYLFSINAIIYIASGFYTPFLSAYYAQKGIDAEKIGILLMIGPCVVLLIQRFWAKISDRTGKRKEVLLVAIVGSGFSMLLYYLGNSFLCMFFATVVVTSFTTAVIPLSDAILIARSLKEGYSYSVIRLGGTLGYAVMTICAGMYLKTRPQMQFVFAFFAYMILFCFCNSFMNVAINSFIANPDLIGLTCVIPLMFATYKCITGLMSIVLELKIRDCKEGQNDKQN